MKWPLVSPDWYFMVLYDDIAVVMKKMLTNPIVVMFMQQAWLPVFSMSHCIMQVDNNFGLHGFKLASCNMHGKSFLSLIGFIKTYNTAETIVGHIGLSCNGKAVTTKDLNQAAAY
jgi:hypothetical protein